MKKKYIKKILFPILFLLILFSLFSFFFRDVVATSSWTQTDWSGGSGQTSWSDITKYDTSSGVTTSTSGQVTLSQTEKLSNTGFESDLSSWSGEKTYSLNDAYTTNRSTGSVNGTASEPTGGNRTVVDTESKLSISSSSLTFSGGKTSPVWTDPILYYPLVARASGKLLTYTQTNTSGLSMIGFAASLGSFPSGAVFYNQNTNLQGYVGAGYVPQMFLPANSTTYNYAIVLRSSGAFLYVKGGIYTNWTLLWVDTRGNTANMYPIIANNSAVQTVDNFKIPTTTWIPSPLAYDTNTRSNGAIGTTETTGPDAQVLQGLSYTGSTWTISSNQAINTPSLGSELTTDGGLENWGSATDLTSWTESLSGTSTINRDNTNANSGTYAVRMNVDGSGNVVYIQQTPGTTANSWHKLSFYTKADSAANYQVNYGPACNGGAGGICQQGSIATSYEQKVITSRTSSASPVLQLRSSSSSGRTIYIDDVSDKVMPTSELFSSVSTSTNDVMADTNITLTSGTQAGVVTNLDSTSNPQNFVIAYHDGTNAHLEKVVGGTYTSLLNTAATYSAGATLRLTKAGTKYRLYYNNQAVGTEQTISDAGIVSNTKHGLFSTYSGNQLDNFSLFARGTSGEYADIPVDDLTTTRDTVTTYSSSVGSAKLVAGGNNANFTQSLNVGDTSTYYLTTYAYTDGSAVTSSDLELYFNDATVSTTYTSMGSGWYKLTGSLTGVASSTNYGVRVKSGKTVYVDSFSLNAGYGASGSINSSIFDTYGIATWGTLTYNVTLPTNTTATIKVRTSSSSSMSGATSFSSCDSIATGVDISSNNCVFDGQRYVQYQISFTTSDISSTPTFNDISFAFSVEASIPGFDLDSPSNDSYINTERPIFKWQAANDSSGISYTLEVDNPSLGQGQPSGDFTISDIPVNRTTDYKTSKYVVHYDNFDDSDVNNNYISVYTKSSNEWSTDSNSGQNDGKLREGRVSWKVSVTDSYGNITERSRSLFVDLNNPTVELTQVNDQPFFADTLFLTTDRTPTIYGNLIDYLSGGDAYSQNSNGPKVASGPNQVEIKVEKEETLDYKIITLYTINMETSWYTCNDKTVSDNTKQTCDKYLPFEYASKENLDPGTYKITLSGKDIAGNVGKTTFTIKVVTHNQITKSKEKVVIEEIQENAETEIKPETDNGLEITISMISNPLSSVQKIRKVAIDSTRNVVSSLRGYVAGIYNGVQIASSGVEKTYNTYLDKSSGVFKMGLLAIGDNFSGVIKNTKSSMSDGIHNLSLKPQNVSTRIGYLIVKLGYIFINEPTYIYNVRVVALSSTSAKISWETNHPANGKVNYGFDETYPLNIQSEKQTTDHEFTLTDLEPNTEYSFEVMSQNKNYVYDANRKFRTLSK